MYKYNLKQVENIANLVRHMPAVGYFAEKNVNYTKWLGLWYIRIWGVFAILLSMLVLFSIILA